MAMLSNSRTSSFYRHIWDNEVTQSKLNGKGESLLDKVQATCTQRGISLIQYICNEDYAKKILREQKKFTHKDGLVDTIRFSLEGFIAFY